MNRGDLRLPEFSNRVMRVVLVYVRLNNRKVDAVLRTEFSQWRIDGDGIVNQAERLRRVVEKIDGIAIDKSDLIERDCDLAAINRCLGINTE